MKSHEYSFSVFFWVLIWENINYVDEKKKLLVGGKKTEGGGEDVRSKDSDCFPLASLIPVLIWDIYSNEFPQNSKPPFSIFNIYIARKLHLSLSRRWLQKHLLQRATKRKRKIETTGDRATAERERKGIEEAFNTTKEKTMSESFPSFHTLQLS